MRATDRDGRIVEAVRKYKGDPQYAPGQEQNGRLMCGARKRDNNPCGAPPIAGGTRCKKHGAAAPAVQAKARERVIEDNARGILGRIDPNVPQENPVEMLVTLIRNKGAEVSWLRGKVQALQDDDLIWNKVEHREGTGPEGPIDVDTYKAEQSVWWKLLREAENQLANWITAALKAGVEERKVRVAESQGALVAGAIKQILDALNLTPDQTALIPQIVPQALRQLNGDNA